jgi:hypothetical protein
MSVKNDSERNKIEGILNRGEMKKGFIIRVLAILSLSMISLTACDQQAGRSTPKTSDEYGPSAVWEPTDEERQAVIACFEGGSKSPCMLEVMRNAGASEAAIEFAEQLGGNGYMLFFEELGTVDLASVIYNGGANARFFPVLVNGSPAIIEVTSLLSELNLDNIIRSDPLYSEFISRYPDAFIWPPDGGISQPEVLESGNRRFTVSYPFYNGCRVCEYIGAVNFGLDFNSDGELLGVKFLGLDVDEYLPGQ